MTIDCFASSCFISAPFADETREQLAEQRKMLVLPCGDEANSILFLFSVSLPYRIREFFPLKDLCSNLITSGKIALHV
jgi:hypothetical protein